PSPGSVGEAASRGRRGPSVWPWPPCCRSSPCRRSGGWPSASRMPEQRRCSSPPPCGPSVTLRHARPRRPGREQSRWATAHPRSGNGAWASSQSPAKPPNWGMALWRRRAGLWAGEAEGRSGTGAVMDDEVFVIGSGPAGLSCAAELTRRGVSATVLEKGARTAQAWAGRYDSLRFNTSRLHSALPGAPFPREWGQFPSRDQYVGYLTEYAEARHGRVHTGVDVLRLDPTREGWSLATNSGRLSSHHVVVATGLANRPVCPRWSQDSSFNGQVLHASAYRNPGPFAGEDVVVVGAGSTGMELAHELARGGAAHVSLSVRTPPNVLLRQTRGVPGDLLVPVLLRLPTAWTDRLLDNLQRRIPGDLTAYGLARPTEG